MNRLARQRNARKLLKWQQLTAVFTLSLALAAVGAILVTIYYNTKLVREQIEGRVAENRPLLDIRKYPLFRSEFGVMYLQIRNVGKGNAYNINYSYHYYNYYTKEIITEYGTTYLDDERFTILRPGEILSSYTEEDRLRFGVGGIDGLPSIHPIGRENEVKEIADTSLVACGVYVEYEDYKRNSFWIARQFVVNIGNKVLAGLPRPGIRVHLSGGEAYSEGPLMERSRARAVKSLRDFWGDQVLDRKVLIQTEQLEDTLSEDVLK